jgi:CRISPR-associated endonuclease/helicase Cas3
MSRLAFDVAFRLLTDYDPFPWQQALYERFVQGRVPSSCNLPTGLGKTAVIPIWLIALAHAPGHVPRRLVYTVNRRVVVDQATREAEKVRENLSRVPDLSEALGKLCATTPDSPLAISTLRGQRAETNDWRADPTRPAVVVGTVDLIGSRLLFQGYRAGFKSRPLFAGFLGQDTLLVHDEAHLEPAFQDLLVAIQCEQERCREFRRFRVVELSATSRGDQTPFELTDADRANAVVSRRINARKSIAWHPLGDPKMTGNRIAELATKHAGEQAILIFARTLADVESIQKKLPPKATRLLTGTLRGYERDLLATKDTVFTRFLPQGDRPPGVLPAPGTVYLVCTSAGEVGVNLSGDHLVCDLTTFDSMAQRFGRVNRFGDHDGTRLDIVYPAEWKAEDDYERRRQRTLALLRHLPGNSASPSALAALLATLPVEERTAAFSPRPTIPATSDLLLDAWALTTIRAPLPGRPPVADWLHGITDLDPPETQVAWRDEVQLLTEAVRRHHDPEELLGDYPLKPHEMLRDRTDRVFQRLAGLVAVPETPAWVVSADGSVRVTTLGEVAEGGKDALGGRTVLLPPRAGGLRGGLLSGEAPFNQEVRYDVADEWFGDTTGDERLRQRTWDEEPTPEGMRCIYNIDTRPDSDDADGSDHATNRRYWRWFTRPRSADDEGSRSAREPQLLDSHSRQVGELVAAFARTLDLPAELAGALRLAGLWHDLGKRRALWQRSIGNAGYPALVLAKSGRAGGLPGLTSYRHEFGSLLDLAALPECQELSADQRDLVLHLVAAHHGRARPHFPDDEASDPERPDDAAAALASEVPRRFARLQRKYGRWGLAYLESLLRAADAWASAYPQGGEG